MANYRCGGLTGIACLTLLTLPGCSRHASDTRTQMQWARDALARNDSIEVVAEDPASRTFTVRVKNSGELRMVRADQMVASARRAGRGDGPPRPLPPPQPRRGAPHAARRRRPRRRRTGARQRAGGQCAERATAPTQPVLTRCRRRPRRGRAGRVLESGPGYSITAGRGGAPSARAAARWQRHQRRGRAASRADRLPGRAAAAHRQPQPGVRWRCGDGRGRLRDPHHQQSHQRAAVSACRRGTPTCTSTTASSRANRPRSMPPKARRCTRHPRSSAA